jgi:hypothetical protein
MGRRRRRALLAVTVVALASAGLTACGDEDFENEPRPPRPLDVSVNVGGGPIVISPPEFGAGITVFTIANLGDLPTTFAVEGPTEAESKEMPPGTTAILRTELAPGDYEATAAGTDAAPFVFEVGPERETANDQLLLP